MNKKAFALACGVASLLAVGAPAQAAGKVYVGAAIGMMDYNESGYDPGISAGFYGGYNLLGRDAHWNADLAGGSLAAEAQITLTASKGDAPSGEWDVNTIAVYAAYRHPFTNMFYGKAKLGIAQTDLEVKNLPSESDKQTGLSAGIGGGFKVGPGAIEIEIANHNSDFLFFSAGFHLNF